MARPLKDDKREAYLKFRTTVSEKVDFYLRAANEGMKGSSYFRFKCFGEKPAVKLATPECQKVIRSFNMLKDLIDFVSGIKPNDKAHADRLTSAMGGIEELIEMNAKALDDN